MQRSAEWLAERGAGKVILASRSGRAAAGLTEPLARMKAAGTRVEVVAADVTDFAAVSAVVKSAAGDGLVLRGVIHAAMVLDDALIRELNGARFRKTLAPKIAGALNLARAAGKEADLDFIVFYSSVSALVGNRGQANYVAANAVLDALAHRLRAEEIPAASINWGALAETGVVARDEKLSAVLESSGISGVTNREAFAVLEKVIREALPQMGAFKVDWPRWHEANPAMAEDPKFSGLHARMGGAGESDAALRIRDALASEPRDKRLAALEEELRTVLAEILKMPPERIPRDKRLGEMGVDSLMVMELGLGVRDRIGIGFSAMEFLKGPSLQQLALLAEKKLWHN